MLIGILVLVLVFIFFFIEVVFNPRLDKTSDGKVLLWYTTSGNVRKYFELW